MALSTNTNKCKVIIKYDKLSSSSYNVNSEADLQTLFDTATTINSIQSIPATGIYRNIEEEIISV